MGNKSIAVLIPCYNESATIEKVVKDYKEALPEAGIYVYDNNSTDKTDEIARKAVRAPTGKRKCYSFNVSRYRCRLLFNDRRG